MALFDVWLTASSQVVDVEVWDFRGRVVWRTSWLDCGGAEQLCAEMLAAAGFRVLTTFDREPRYSFAVAGDADVRLPVVSAPAQTRTPRRRRRRRQAERCRDATLFDLPTG